MPVICNLIQRQLQWTRYSNKGVQHFSNFIQPKLQITVMISQQVTQVSNLFVSLISSSLRPLRGPRLPLLMKRSTSVNQTLLGSSSFAVNVGFAPRKLVSVVCSAFQLKPCSNKTG